MSQYPTQSLQPGQSGPAVKQLQEYLVANGYLSQADMNTGPGIYGNRTKAAVAAFQQAMGVDTAGNPGFWGPRTINAINAKIESTKTELASKQEELKKTQVAASETPAETPKSEVEQKTEAEEKKVQEEINKMSFKNSAEYKALSKDLQDLVDTGVRAFLGTDSERSAFTDALTKAQQLADPYAKSQLALYKAEFGTKIAQTTEDYKASKDILERTRGELAEDLKRNKDFLTLEQQADMAKTLRGYDEDLLTIADQAAEKGITFATGARSRALAEERRGVEYQDVIQSGQREFNFKVKDLELRAARGDQEAKDKLNQIERNKGFDLQKIGQSAERILGSTGAAALGLPGYTPQGGSLGEVEQERRKSILEIASTAIPQ